MKDKHTPGPWYLEDIRKDTYKDMDKPVGYGSMSLYASKEIGKCPWIAAIHGTHVGEADDSVNVANARLIASSPCLLAALRALLEARAIKGQGYRKARERAWGMAEGAVARAEGGEDAR